MTAPILRLAQLVIDDPARAVEQSARLLLAAKAKKARVRVKQAPRKKAAKVESVAAIGRRVELRREVFFRAGSLCEMCGRLPPTELHHALSGPSRRGSESVDTCAAICMPCHRLVHKNDPEALQDLQDFGLRIRSPKVVSALQRRIDKVTR